MATTAIASRYSVPNVKQSYQAVIQTNILEGNMCEWNRVSENIHASCSKIKDCNDRSHTKCMFYDTSRFIPV